MLRCLEGKITGFRDGGKRLVTENGIFRVGRRLREALAWEGVVGCRARLWARGDRLVALFPLDPPTGPEAALVCMGKSCRRRGAAETAARLEESGLKVARVKCLDECGRGPNVCLLPGKILVHRVRQAPGGVLSPDGA